MSIAQDAVLADALGLVDVSEVTALLIANAKAAWAASEVWKALRTAAPEPGLTGTSPDRLRNGVSIYLYHLAEDKAREFQQPFWPNAHTPGEPMPVVYQPLGLRLSYLVTASFDGENGWETEQRALSIVMRCFHEQPVLMLQSSPPPAPAAGAAPQWQAFVTMETRTDDELSRLWQATATPLRTSAVYQVTVVFLKPTTKRTTGNRVTRLNAEVMPAEVPS